MAQISLLVLSTVLTVLALAVLRARPSNSVNRWFAAQTIFLASWILGVSGLQSGTNLTLWGRFTFASASLIPAAFLAFTRCYPTTTGWPSFSTIRFALSCGTVFAVFALSTPLVVQNVSLNSLGLSRKTGALYPAFSVYFLITWIAALGVFIRKWRNARGVARAQLQYLGAGIIISVAGGVGINFLLPLITGSSSHSWIGPYFSVGFVALVAHAIIRHRLMDLRLVVNRSLAYVFIMALMSALVIAIARLVVPDWGTRAFALDADFVIAGTLILVMLSAPFQTLFTRVIDPYLYRGRIEYSSALQDATHRLSRLMQPAELSSELRRILTDVFFPESFTMIAKPLSGGAIEQLTADTQSAPDLVTAAVLSTDQSIRPSLLVVNPARETGPQRIVHEALRAAGVEVVMYLGRREQLLGVILLGPRRSGDAYFNNDLAFIEALTQLASIALENALLYRQRIQMLEYSNRLLESLDAAVVAVDITGKITSFNPAAKSLLGLTDESLGERLEALPPEVAWALAFAITGLWPPSEVEVTIDHHTRGLLPVLVSTAVLHDDQNQITGALVIATDLSTIKALEHHQRRIEHFALMARFYAGIAHEIRSPLAAISNFIAMLPDRFDDPEYRDTATRLLPIEVSRIVHLADRLRLMAPSEGGKLTVVSLPLLLRDIVTIHTPSAHEQAIKIQLSCPDFLPNILGDPSQLIQLFVNLLKNAIEAMPDGGTVTIEVAHVRGRQSGDQITVCVIDEGIGIEPTIRAKIFEPFFTTKPSGTGLGLSICREIANFHRARLILLPRINAPGVIAQVEFPSCSVDATRDIATSVMGSN